MLEKVRELYRQGKRNKDIVQILGISNSLVAYYKKRLGIKREKKNYPLAKTEQRLINTGLTREELVQAGLRFSRKKANASKGRHEFSIVFDDIIWNKICPILGIPLDYFAEVRAENSVSFDRLDPLKGYIPGNVNIISWRANRIKNDGVLEEFKKIVDYLENK